MAKVITFSRHFPSYHPRKGEPTYFVEKIYNSLYDRNNLMDYPEGLDVKDPIREAKHHTIRAGHRFKAGDCFSPRVWSGKPYNSKQIIIGPDIQVKKVWDLSLIFSEEEHLFLSNDIDPDTVITTNQEKQIAANDGLSHKDLLSWFNKPFDGQIICWNENINY